MNMQGKTGLVLGASRGIGLAIARMLARQGMRLALPWFDWPESTQAMIREFSQDGENHFCCETDLRDQAAVATLMADIKRITLSTSALPRLNIQIPRRTAPIGKIIKPCL